MVLHQLIKDFIMKKHTLYLIPLLVGLILMIGGCKEMPIDEADASFIAVSLNAAGSDEATAGPGETLTAKLIGGVAVVRVEFKGFGQNKSIWWGTNYNALDATQEIAPKNYFTSYDQYLAGNVTHDGASFNKYGVARFRYLVAGTYTIHVISSNWQEGSGTKLERDIKTLTLQVVE